MFEGVERRGLFEGPEEPFLLQQLCEGRGDGTIVLNEPAVLPHQPEQATEPPHGARLGPSGDGLDLVAVHGNPLGRDHMAEVRDRRLREGALGALEPQLALA